MTVHDLLEYAEHTLREDKEYWAQMDKLRTEIEQLIYKQRQIMACVIIRLAVAMETEKSNSKWDVSDTDVPTCEGCNGKVCEICTEGKDDGD